MKNDNEEFYVFAPKNHEVIPIFCPICEFAMRTFDDVLSYKESKCCFLCETTFIKSSIPLDKESDFYKNYIKKRKKNNKISIDFE